MEVLFGKDRADEERVLSYRDLQRGLEKVSPEMQALAPTKNIDDPNLSQGGLHYQKGQLFMQHLEHVFGRDQFDPFLAGYFKRFAFQSISSEQFLDYMDQNLLQEFPRKFTRSQAEEWLYQAGIPADATRPQSTTLDQAARLATAWAVGEIAVADIPLAEWSPQATVHFINNLPMSLAESQLRELDETFGFSQTRNAEIGRAWFTQVAARRHLPAYSAMEEHLLGNGRIHLIDPVYQALVENGQDTALAEKVFEQAKAGYHPLTVMIIERSLKTDP
jgi:hypothetical protein